MARAVRRPSPMAAQTREGPEGAFPGGVQARLRGHARFRSCGDETARGALHARYGVQKIESRREAAGADDDVRFQFQHAAGDAVYAEVAPLVEPEA